MKTEKGKSAGDVKKKFIIIIGSLTIIVLLAIIVYLLMDRAGNNVDGEQQERRNVVVNHDNVDDVIQQMAEAAQNFVEPGYYTVMMDTDWHFSKGDAVSDDAIVENLIEHTNDVYFDVFLLEDESEAIYKSPVIPRGSYLENIVLDTPLEKGIYDCVIVYHLVDEEQETVSTLRVAFTITVDS